MIENNANTKFTFKQKLLLWCLALFCIVFSVIIFAPAAWVSAYLQSKTDGRLVLNNVEGSLWSGSAFIGVAMDENSDLTPLLPGRFEWNLSPILLLGQIDLLLENYETLQQPLYVTGNFAHIQFNPNSLSLPAERLAGLGAPLNTIKPMGKMVLSWDVLRLAFDGSGVDIEGAMELAIEDIATALSPVRPLGSYRVDFNWHGRVANVVLTTVRGPMLLSGEGVFAQGRLQFSGLARAEKEQEENLANLLNLLGQRRAGADKNVISLEFK